MSDETSDLDEMLGFFAEEGRHRRDPEEHPSPETLTAYQANELSEEEDKRIQDHLALCRHCTELLLDLEEFLKPPVPAAAPAADFEAAADWRRLRRKIEAERPETFIERVPGASFSRRFLGAPKTAYALAAVFAMATLGLSLYVQSLRQDLRSFELSPRLVVLSSGTTRSVEPKAVELPQREEDLIAVILTLPPGVSYPEYRVGVHSEQGGRVFDRDGLKAQKTEGVVFLLPSKSLESGLYEITLEGLKPGKAELVGRYEIEILRK